MCNETSEKPSPPLGVPTANAHTQFSFDRCHLWKIFELCTIFIKVQTEDIYIDYRALGTLSCKKNGKKRGHCPLLATPPPKRVKRGHLLSDYRQKCVNGTRDSYCGVKSPFLSDLRLILTHIVVSKDSYWLILWCQKSISEWFETHIVVSKVHFWVIWESGKFGLKKGTGVDPLPPRTDNVPFFTVCFKG